jgi:hypothetical protein
MCNAAPDQLEITFEMIKAGAAALEDSGCFDGLSPHSPVFYALSRRVLLAALCSSGRSIASEQLPPHVVGVTREGVEVLQPVTKPDHFTRDELHQVVRQVFRLDSHPEIG